jgi:hypothetical protein
MPVPTTQSAPANPFGFLFGGGQRWWPPATSAYADPSVQAQPPRASSGDAESRSESGPAVAYCVRLCDGRFFPIQRSAATPAEICSSFCPASRTRIYSGSGIDHAVAHDGSDYADLPTAFVYRTRTVADCSCNGKDAFGLVQISPNDDPTLRPGDVVATEQGFVSYGGGKKKGANFSPIDASSGLSSELRRQLSQTRIAPAADTADSSPSPAGTAAERAASDRRAQLAK